MNQPALVGRSGELAVLAALLEAARLGEPGIAFVEGDAGIGKTRLLDELASLAVAGGGLVVRGSAPPPTGQPLPFAALSQLLRDVVRVLPPDEREPLIAATPELALLQPAWRLAAGGATPGPTSLTILCERLLDVLQSLAAGRPYAVVLLDDLHWADAGTLDLVAYVAHAPREAPVVVVLAARDDDAPPDAPVRAARAGILRGRVSLVRLEPLGPDAVEALLAEAAGDAPRDGLRRVRELGDGNPLYLSELADAARRGEAEPPEGLIALVEARIAALDPARLGVLRAVAVLSDGVPAEHLIPILDASEATLFEVVRSLVAQRLLSVTDDGIVTVTQPLVGAIVGASVLAAERRRVHAAAARAMVADPASDPRPEVERLVRLAEHWDAAGDRLRAIPALLRAAAECERVFAFATAFELYGRALAEARPALPADDRQLGFRSPSAAGGRPSDAASRDPASVELYRHAVDAAVLAGHPDIAITWADDWLTGLPRSDTRTALEVARARALLAAGDAGASADAFEATIAGRDPVPAIAATGLARALLASGSPERALSVAEAAVRSARAAGSGSEEIAALLVLGSALASTGQVEAATERIAEARSLRAARTSATVLAPRMSRVIDLTGGYAEAARAVRAAGSGDAAASLAEEAQATAVRLGAEGEAARLRLDGAVAAFDEGRWDEALTGLASLDDQPGTRVVAAALRARILVARGAWKAAATELARIAGPALVRSRPADRAAYAVASVELLATRRETEAALAAVIEGLALTDGTPERDRATFLAVAARAVADATLAARALRAPTDADERTALLAALGGRIGEPGTGEPWLRALRLTSRAEVGRASASPALPPDDGWADVREAWDALDAPWWSAYARLREAETALTATRRRDAARASLGQAKALVDELEAAPLAADILAVAARSRIDLPSATVAEEPMADRRLPISDRELEVLVLLARGLTNKEIAATLFISEKTAAHHVEHIFDKLGVSSRVEAAGIAHQAGLVS